MGPMSYLTAPSRDKGDILSECISRILFPKVEATELNRTFSV